MVIAKLVDWFVGSSEIFAQYHSSSKCALMIKMYSYIHTSTHTLGDVDIQ